MTNREEISLEDLHAVMEAAKLLRNYGFISVESIGEIRLAVNKDAWAHLQRHEHAYAAGLLSDDQAAKIDAVAKLQKETRPL